MDINFACRPKTAAGKYPTYNYSDITWSPYGPYWRQARKLCVVELFRDLLGTLSLNVINRMVLGKKILDETEVVKSMVSGEEFKKMVYEWILLNGVLNIGDWIPWIGFMVLQKYVKRMKTMSKNFDLFLENVLNEHDERRRLEAENFVSKDMVDLLLQIYDDTTLDVKFERHGVKAFTLVH
ncbi:cytochrome P450 71A1-like protein [Tanacetum coccineum]|uniref:Cytochrome P450 71A1-like protein n=1 Tax=Tanacetum coccineum TaxID=301880 RepID=A0ABQ5CKJ0_9ASTR